MDRYRNPEFTVIDHLLFLPFYMDWNQIWESDCWNSVAILSKTRTDISC